MNIKKNKISMVIMVSYVLATVILIALGFGVKSVINNIQTDIFEIDL